MKVVFNLTQWPGGYGLDVETDKHDYGFAGRNGGGVGHTIERFTTSKTQVEKLIEILQEVVKDM